MHVNGSNFKMEKNVVDTKGEEERTWIYPFYAMAMWQYSLMKVPQTRKKNVVNMDYNVGFSNFMVSHLQRTQIHRFVFRLNSISKLFPLTFLVKWQGKFFLKLLK